MLRVSFMRFSKTNQASQMKSNSMQRWKLCAMPHLRWTDRHSPASLAATLSPSDWALGPVG